MSEKIFTHYAGPHTEDGVYHDSKCPQCIAYAQKKSQEHHFFEYPNPKSICHGSGHPSCYSWYNERNASCCPICFCYFTGKEGTPVPLHQHPQGSVSSPQDYRMWINHETGEIKYLPRNDYKWS